MAPIITVPPSGTTRGSPRIRGQDVLRVHTIHLGRDHYPFLFFYFDAAGVVEQMLIEHIEQIGPHLTCDRGGQIRIISFRTSIPPQHCLNGKQRYCGTTQDIFFPGGTYCLDSSSLWFFEEDSPFRLVSSRRHHGFNVRDRGEKASRRKVAHLIKYDRPFPPLCRLSWWGNWSSRTCTCPSLVKRRVCLGNETVR